MIGSQVPAMSEADLQSFVIELAQVLGWLAYHTHDSRHSAAGFPDCVLVRGDRIIFAELKSEAGRVTEAQAEWLLALEAVHHVEVHIWRPSDVVAIEAALR